MSTKQPSGEWHLAHAVEHEIEELVQHPREEVHRLREEAESGESGITLAIILTTVAILVTVAVTVVLLIVWLSAGGL